MTKQINMIGMKYGKLTVVSVAGKDHRGIRYDCKCDCGKLADNIAGRDLRTGNKTSCGCNYGNRRRTHGMFGKRPYNTWNNMKRRCSEPSNKSYGSYGARGIRVCEEWNNSFESFWADMKEGYADNLTLDRIDVDGDYSKENCRWVDIKTQENNRTNNLIIKFNGEDRTLSEIADITGVNYSSIQNRLRAGMPIEEAVSIPLQEQITYNGVTKSVSEFAKEFGITYYQLKKRLMRGWSVDRALTQPLRK